MPLRIRHTHAQVSIAFRLKEWHGGGNILTTIVRWRHGVSIAFRLKEWHGDRTRWLSPG